MKTSATKLELLSCVRFSKLEVTYSRGLLTGLLVMVAVSAVLAHSV